MEAATYTRVSKDEQRVGGVSLEAQPRPWEKFYWGRRVAGLNAVPGSCIGLAVARALVEAQRGWIGLDSRPRRGASFWFELPADAR